jgi:hypothetical protein
VRKFLEELIRQWWERLVKRIGQILGRLNGTVGDVFVPALSPFDDSVGYYRGRSVRDGDVVDGGDGKQWRVRVVQVNQLKNAYPPPDAFGYSEADWWGPEGR